MRRAPRRGAHAQRDARVLRGELRKDPSEDHVILRVEDVDGRRWLVRVALADVRHARPLRGHPHAYELTVARGAQIGLRVCDPIATVGGGTTPGVPFILSTPHHITAVRNPESMGGVQPVDPWRGPLPMARR